MFLSEEETNISPTPLMTSRSYDYSLGNTRDPCESGVRGFHVTSYLESNMACNKLYLIPSAFSIQAVSFL